jgi:hypothetical protein
MLVLASRGLLLRLISQQMHDDYDNIDVVAFVDEDSNEDEDENLENDAIIS